MALNAAIPPKEGLQVTRLIMVISSMAPLFVLWALRGAPMIPDKYFLPTCLVLAVVPTWILIRRVRIARRHNDAKVLVVGTADDHRDHILVYLFAMLLPFYSEDLDQPRQLASTLLALVFVIFLFWHLNMHYMNLGFAVRGYRVFTITPPAGRPKPPQRAPLFRPAFQAGFGRPGRDHRRVPTQRHRLHRKIALPCHALRFPKDPVRGVWRLSRHAGG